MIKAISLDLDGVYFLDGKVNFIFNLLNLGVSELDSRQVFFSSDKMNNEYKKGKITDAAFWTWAAREWGIDKSPEDLIELLISGYKLNREGAEFIRKARKIGYKVLSCTNNFPARIKGLDEKFKFLRDFDLVLTSYEVGATKPDPKIYKDLVSRAEVQPSELVFVDDSPDNLKPAVELGMSVISYKDYPSLVSSLKQLGVEV